MPKINISTSRKPKKSSFNLSSSHVTTFDVGQTRPTNIFIASPEDTFECDVNLFARLSPLVVPTFGSFHIKTHAFFVPFHTIFEKFEEWMVRSADTSLGVSSEPYNFSLADFYYVIFGTPDPVNTAASNFNTNSWLRVVETSTGTLVDPDENKAFDIQIVHYTASGPQSWRTFFLTDKGKSLFNLMHSLGYEVPSVIRYYGSFANTEDVELSNWLQRKQYNLFPLLAYARVMYDYIYPSRFVQQQNFGFLFNDAYREYTISDILHSILRLTFTKYNDDFFQNLWMSFNSPNNSNNGFSTLSGNSFDSAYTPFNSTLIGQSNANGTRIEQGSQTNTPTLSSYALSWLQKVSDYVLRSGIGGTRFNEWMKSHFGFVTSDQNYNRSIYIKSFDVPVEIGDVTNMSAFESMSVLGEQAGKGWASSREPFHFTYDCKEHGFLIFITSVIPSTGLYQGNKPWTRALKVNTDLYTPEFDSLGNEAIPRSAVYSSYDKDYVTPSSESSPYVKVNPGSLENVFGFAPKYAWLYKTPFDYLTGDFRFRSKNALLSSYHTFRDVLYGRNNLALDAQFMSVDNQYDRIFATTPDDAKAALFDKIFCMMNFKVIKKSYMLTLGESLPLFEKSGDNTELEYLGSDI